MLPKISCIFILLFSVQHYGFSQNCSAISGSSADLSGLGGYGNAQVDRIVIEELRNLSRSFLVKPAFYFFNDGNQHNAYSTSESLKDESADGTVVFGRGLHQDQMYTSQGGTNVPIILAHEFAHTVARKYNLDLEGKDNELFADYMAGGYMFYRNRDFKSTDIAAALRAFAAMGDNLFTSPSHHGTAASRNRCIRQGYLDCKNAAAAGRDFSLQEGIDLGVKFVTTNDLP